MDKPQGHYAEWNKPVTKGQILYDSTHMKYLSNQNHKAESRKVIAKGQWEGEGELVFSEQSFSFSRWKSSRDLWHNNVNILNILKCTLKNRCQ